MKKIFLITAFLFSLLVNAQVKKVSLQASGLTCSMCSNTIHKSLQSLGFVQEVNANIKNATFDIWFKPGSQVDFDKLRRKVEDAGFFVAGLTATINFENVTLLNDSHVLVDGNTYHFLNCKDQFLSGDKAVRILDKGFVSAREYKKNSRFTLMQCYKTGVIGACCAKNGPVAGTRVIHVTI